MATVEERFWAKVDKTGDCWIWTACKIKDGYGHFRGHGGQLILAHRFAYQNLVGPIPSHLVSDHLCLNTSCVNPDHIELVTMAENSRRARKHNREKTHCIHGHEFTPENTKRFGPNKRHRSCRACSQITNRAFKARQKLLS